jgi:hypothetical protein
MWIVRLLVLWDFAIIYLGPATLFNDLASWRRFLIRDEQFSVEIVVNVIVLALGLGNRCQTKEKGKQSCTSADAFHKKPLFAPADRAKGVPGSWFL